MRIVEVPFTRQVYWPRIEPLGPILAVLHDTGNANNQAAGAAMVERNYANSHDGGPSANYYLDRLTDQCVHALDEDVYVAWSQGDVTNPVTSNPGVAAALAWMAHDPRRNFNDAVYASIEIVALYPTYPWVDRQFEDVAQLLAKLSKASGIPITRSTVLDHSDINTVNRPNDPFPSTVRETYMARIISRANEILKGDTDVAARLVQITGPASGTATFVGDNHWYLSLDGTGDGPWPAGAKWTVFAEGKLAVPIAGGTAGQDRQSVLLIQPAQTHDGKPVTEAAVILKCDTDWPKGNTDLTAQVTSLQTQVTSLKSQLATVQTNTAAFNAVKSAWATLRSNLG